jgi:tRNA threonylcarbamoyladenosine biosynthesis protein TsaE
MSERVSAEWVDVPSRLLADDEATRRAGALFAQALDAEGHGGVFITLSGELGAGKTTFVRGVLAALGVTGPVRSPTYALIETYEVGGRRIDHLDWYRLSDAGDLEGLGFRDLVATDWVLVEWPEQVPEVAAGADLAIRLDYEGTARRVRLRPGSAVGRRLAKAFHRTDTM